VFLLDRGRLIEKKKLGELDAPLHSHSSSVDKLLDFFKKNKIMFSCWLSKQQQPFSQVASILIINIKIKNKCLDNQASENTS